MEFCGNYAGIDPATALYFFVQECNMEVIYIRGESLYCGYIDTDRKTDGWTDRWNASM